MNIYTPLSFFAFLLSIYMGVYVMRLNSRSSINRVFLGLAMAMAIWNFAYMFIYPDLDKNHIFFWYRVSALGWANFPAFVLHFFLLLAQKKSLFQKAMMWLLIYLPGIVFTIKAMIGGFLASDFEAGPGNAIYEIQNFNTLWNTIYIVYLWIFILSGVLAFAYYSRRTKIKKIKSQSRIFLFAVFFLFAAIVTTNLILPSLNIKIIPAVGGIILILWMFTIWYAIVKYKLMAFTVESAANELISEMKELLFFIDTDKKIIRVNSFTASSLGFKINEIINTKFCELVVEKQKVYEILENIEQANFISEIMLNLRLSDDNTLPVSLSFSGIKDKTGDHLGILIVGWDITVNLQLQKEIEYRKEAELQIQQQNEVLTKQKVELQKMLSNLKEAQTQLIQSEKMASLGELTAGIAHEIQNPLNFVNNFSEVSNELLDEMKEEMKQGNNDEVKAIAENIRFNLEKINNHGKRADSIVKGMLQHSRDESGLKEPTDLNALCDEFLRLAYHGLRAKDKSFNAVMKTDFDKGIEKINIVPQDIGRAVLNLINNAFQAVTLKKKESVEGFEPTVLISTKKVGNNVEIRVRDNGTGIPEKLKSKIFQPFFTTRPTGQGTGLGLSLAHEIITKGHGGSIEVENREGEGVEMIITIPIIQ